MKERGAASKRVSHGSIGTRTPTCRAMRGSMDLRVLGLLVLLSVAGFVWIQMRHGHVAEKTRLFRYKDERGRIAYTDSLEKVPTSQREAALNDKAVPDINRLDYDQYLDSFSGTTEEETGFWGFLKNLLRAEPSGTKKGPGFPVTAGAPAKKDRGSEGPTSKEALKKIGDVPKFVNGSLSSLSKQLGGGS